MDYELDRIDRGILHALQEDARGITTEELGERVNVSASTARNRIQRMEDAGIIRGFHPEIDYQKAGYQLHVLFVCVADADDRATATERALDVTGVVQSDELIGGDENILVEAVAADNDHLAEINDGLETLPLAVRRTEIFRRSCMQPFNHFGSAPDDGDAATRD